jgi:hypothetical protein
VALKWSTVKPEHVTKACETLLRGEQRPRAKAKGIFVAYKGHSLPGKHVARLAYCFANNLPPNTVLKFSSGDGVVNLLNKLGFSAQRIQSASPEEMRQA